MSEESILLIDQMEANGESPEAIAEVLRKKEEEDKDNFNPGADLVNKIKQPIGKGTVLPKEKYTFDKGIIYREKEIQKTDISGKLLYDENKNPIYETVHSVVSEKDVPKNVLLDYQNSIKSDLKTGQKDQGVKEFLFGETEVDVEQTDVMNNINTFKPSITQVEEVQDNVNQEIENWKNNNKELALLNDEIKNTPVTSIPEFSGNMMMTDIDGADASYYNTQVEQQAQEKTEFRQRLLSGRNEIESKIKNSRVGDYLRKAAKLWPKNKPISERTDEWLFANAAMLMQEDDENGIFEANIAQYKEDNQGILQVTRGDWEKQEVKKAEEYKELLTTKQEDNLVNQNFLAENITDLDIEINNKANILNSIDYSTYEDSIKKYDEQIALLGDVNENSSPDQINEWNRLNNERNVVVGNYQKAFQDNLKIYNNFIDQVEDRKKLYRQYNNTIQLDTEFNKNGEDLVSYINMMKRNHHNIAVAAAWVGSSTLNIISGLEGKYNALKELPEDLLFEYYDNDPNNMPDLVKLIHTIDGVDDQMRYVGKDKFNKFIEDINNSVQKPTEYEDINNLSDLGAFGMNVIANFVPQYALMATTGPASIYIMGATSFGNKYDEMEFTNRQVFGRTNYTLAEKWAASSIAFGSEVISESLTYGVFKAKMKGLNTESLKRVADGMIKNTIETSKKIAKRTITSIPYMYQESVSEVFAQVGNNFGDRYVLGKNISLLDNTKSAALSGLFMERSMSMPGVYADVSKIFSGKNYRQKVVENNARKKKIEKLLANPDLNPKIRNNLENEFLKLVAKNETLMAKNVENIDLMSNQEKENLIKIDTEVIEIRATEDAVRNDKSLNDNQKETIIEDLRNQENELENQRDDIVVQYETEETRKKKKERYEKQLKQIKDKVNRFNKRKIKDFKSTNDGARGRVKVFKTREEQQAFFNNRISEHNALLQKEKEAWKEILKDPSKLNEADREAIGLEEGGKLLDHHVNQINNFIKEIDSQIQENNYNSRSAARNYGGFATDKYGGFEIFINEQNSLAVGGRINTAAHEFLHGVLFKSIGKDPETQKALGDAVINFMVENKGGFSRRFARRMEPYQGDSEFGEEIITIMSESIMDKTLDYNENFFTKINDVIRQHLQRLGIIDIQFNTGRDVYNFIKDYNASIEKNYDSVAIEKMMDQGAKGKLLRKTKKTKPTDQLMASKEDVGLVARAKRNLKKYQDSVTDNKGVFIREEYNPNSDIITAELPGMIKAQVDNYFKRRPKLQIDNLAKEELQQEILFRLYDTTKEGKNDLNRFDGRGTLYGYLNGRIKYRMLDAFEFNPTIMPDFTQQQLDEARAQLDDETTEPVIEEKIGPTREVVALDSFGESELQNEIRTDVKTVGVEGVEKYLDVKKETVKHRKFMKDGTEITPELKAKYKDDGKKPPKELKSLRVPTGKFYFILEKVAAKYGITDPIRLITEKDLDTKQRKSAQDYILSRRDEHIVSLPEGTTKSGDPTGIATTALGKAFFKKGGRTKFKTTGTGKGLAEQAKQRIEPMAYLEIFGLIPKARVNNPSVDPAIRSQIIQTTVIAIDQAIRQEKDALQLSQQRVDKLKDGKGKIMFAKNEYNLSEVTEGNFKDLYVHPLGTLSSIHNIELSIKKTFYRTSTKTGKRVPYRSRDLDAMFSETETYRDAGARVLNTFLESHPQFRDLIRITMTGGLEGGFFQTKDNFNNLINKTDVKQEYLARKKYSEKGALYNKNYHKKINTKEFKDQNDARLPQLYNFFKAVEAHLQNYPEDVWMFEEMLLDTGKQQNVLTRILAPFSFYAVDGNGNPIFDQKIKEEHTDPQNLIGKALLAGAVFNNVDKVWKVVGKSYMQGAILDSDINPHDKMIDDAGLSNEMPQVYYDRIVPRLLSGELKLPNGYSSIVRLAAAGIDLNMYKLAAEGVTIAEYFRVEGMEVSQANELIIKQLTGEVDALYAETIKDIDINPKIKESKIINNAVKQGRIMASKPSNGITVLDFDDTLATTESLVRFVAPDGTKGTLNAEEYASTYQDLLAQGYKFDFTEFNKVVKGKLAPLFNKAIKLQGKFGPENMFVLTARPPAAQKPIFDFLKANGLNIPLENITGLGNSTSEAKALWIADKVGEGYNDFYFADDALQNVQAVKNMLDQFDVKSKVQQAKVKFSKDIDGEFNDILEETTGMQSEKEFSAAKAKLRGKGKGRFNFFIPPSAEDFKGLLYRFLAKGKKGDQQMAWFKKALLDPFARGYRELNEAKQAMWNDYNALRKAMPDVRKKLTKIIKGQKDFRYSDAVRVYLWDKAGYTIPGLSQTDLARLIDIVNNDSELKAYADTLGLISKRPEGYVEPSQEWLVGNIMSDLEGANKVNRAEFLAEWIENKDIIFSEKNLNKIEALYGANFREALEDMLYRMEKGTNRITGSNRLVNAFQNWINNSVGAIMFFNARSAVLQTLSTVNFINWGDNNMYAAAMAFANQKQFWKDFVFLFNSDMLKQRRKGLKTDVNTAELTEAVGRSKNPVMAALNYLLQKGFLPTQIADSFAISSGGATFYRNRVNTYLKQGLSQKEAETKAFEDFQEIAEETQQSSRPDLISQQQASTLGRLILAFQNTPMQYMRLTKKAISDLVNGRGDAKTNISRILYYGAVQNVIFYSLQSALFALAFDDDEDDEKRAKTEEKKMKRLYNGMLDSILRGTGVGGAVVSTIKNMIIKIGEEESKGWNKDFDNVVVEGLQLSPPIGSKVRKLRSAGRSWSYNRDVIKKMDFFDIDNPVWDAVGNVVSALTNVPMDRIVNKTKNVRESLNEDNATWQRIALMLGWNRWDLNVKSDKIELVKTIVKEEKKQKAKEKRDEKKREEEALKQLEIDNTIKEEIKEEKEAKEQGKEQKEYTCANVNSKGKRCSIVVPKAGMRCTIHEKVEQRTDGKKSQCEKIKNDGKRCKMQTSNKSGYCYYHD